MDHKAAGGHRLAGVEGSNGARFDAVTPTRDIDGEGGGPLIS